MVSIREVINDLKGIIEWSNRIGSDEINAINDIIFQLENNKFYTKSDMEESFIAGGKSCRNINNPGFDEFINNKK